MKLCEKIIDEFTINIEKSQAVTIPAIKNPFKIDRSKPPNKNKVELFHTTVARGLVLCKRVRPDIHTTIEVLCTRVKHHNQGD